MSRVASFPGGLPEADQAPTRHLPRSIVLLLVVCVLVSILEVGAYLIGSWPALLAAWLWVAAAAGFVAVTITVIGRTLVADVRRGNLGVLVLVAGALFVALNGIGGVKHLALGPESTREMASALVSLQRPDLGYTGIGPMGSPARQYFLPSVSSLLMGRSVLALRLGYACLLVLGLLVCWTGLRASLSSLRQAGDIAALTVLSFLSFPSLVGYERLYTQIGLPATLVMFAIGWLFLAGDRPSPLRLSALAWIGCLLGTCSPPGLTSLALLAIFVAAAAVIAARRHDRSMALAWGTLLLPMATFTGCSFLVRRDIVFPGSSGLDPRGLWPPLATTLRAVFFGQPELFLSPLLLLPLLVYLLVALLGGAKLHDGVLAWWTLAVLVSTVVLHSHPQSHPETAIHAALVVIPPLVIGVSLWALRVVWGEHASHLPRQVLAGTAAVLLVAAAVQVRETGLRHPPRVSDIAFSDIVARVASLGADSAKPPTLVLLTSGIDLDDADAYLRYFLPKHRLLHSTTELRGLIHGPVLVYADAGRWPTRLRAAGFNPQGRLTARSRGSSLRLLWAVEPNDLRVSSGETPPDAVNSPASSAPAK